MGSRNASFRTSALVAWKHLAFVNTDVFASVVREQMLEQGYAAFEIVVIDASAPSVTSSGRNGYLEKFLCSKSTDSCLCPESQKRQFSWIEDDVRLNVSVGSNCGGGEEDIEWLYGLSIASELPSNWSSISYAEGGKGTKSLTFPMDKLLPGQYILKTPCGVPSPPPAQETWACLPRAGGCTRVQKP